MLALSPRGKGWQRQGPAQLRRDTPPPGPNACDIRGVMAATPSDFQCEVADVIANQVLSSLGKSHARDKRQAVRRIVSEIYSPPRVTAEITRSRSRHLLPGFAMDLTICDPTDGKPWDFNSEATREKARTELRRSPSYLLIGSPMCTAFCTWQVLNYAKSSDKAALDRA